jgi:hypothetical protein
MGIPRDGLVGAYPMNHDASDISGRAHHGQIGGVTPTPNRFCAPDRALFFDGVASVLTIPRHDDFSVNTTGYLSISAWIRPEGTTLTPQGELVFARSQGSGYVHWLGKGDRYGAHGNQEWSFRIYSAGNTEGRHNRLSAYVFRYRGGKGPGSHVEEPVASGGWIHLVAVFSKPHHQLKLFKNGVLRDVDGFGPQASYPIADPDVRSGDAPVRIGSQDGDSYFRGAIDDVYFYNRMLRDEEIAALYLDVSPP